MNVELRTAFNCWYNQSSPRFAFTGTSKQCLHPVGAQHPKQWVTSTDLAKNVHFFVERVSRDLLGRSAVRKGHKVGYYGVIEGGERPVRHGGQRFHVHLHFVDVPKHVSLNQFRASAVKRWITSKWGYHDCHIDEFCSLEEGPKWTNYMLKSITNDSTDRLITNKPFQK